MAAKMQFRMSSTCKIHAYFLCAWSHWWQNFSNQRIFVRVNEVESQNIFKCGKIQDGRQNAVANDITC